MKRNVSWSHRKSNDSEKQIAWLGGFDFFVYKMLKDAVKYIHIYIYNFENLYFGHLNV